MTRCAAALGTREPPLLRYQRRRGGSFSPLESRQIRGVDLGLLTPGGGSFCRRALGGRGLRRLAACCAFDLRDVIASPLREGTFRRGIEELPIELGCALTITGRPLQIGKRREGRQVVRILCEHALVIRASQSPVAPRARDVAESSEGFGVARAFGEGRAIEGFGFRIVAARRGLRGALD